MNGFKQGCWSAGALLEDIIETSHTIFDPLNELFVWISFSLRLTH